MPSSVAARLADIRRSAPLEGADGVGEARGGERLVVRVGLWTAGERVMRARYRATTCASLVAYAEVACELVEEGASPGALTAERLREALRDVHPVHLDRATLVAAAVRAAAAATRSSP